MDHLVTNINPCDIVSKKTITEYQFTFLDHISPPTKDKYYELLLSLHLFKIKHIYNFIFLRLLKINQMFPSIHKININKYIQTHEEFNQELHEYIKDNKVNAIIIMNCIQHYFYPFLSG